MYSSSAVAQRRNESGENFINVGLKVTRATRDQLEDIGNAHDRPLGYVARKLVLRGLAAYQRDHQLDESALIVRPDTSLRAILMDEPDGEPDDEKRSRDLQRVKEDDPLKE